MHVRQQLSAQEAAARQASAEVAEEQRRQRDLVEQLRLRAEQAGTAPAEIQSLAQLRALPGMGGRAIARACEGLVSVGEVGVC